MNPQAMPRNPLDNSNEDSISMSGYNILQDTSHYSRFQSRPAGAMDTTNNFNGNQNLTTL